MNKKDTISLLKECDAGTRMAIESIEDMLEHTENEKMKKALQKSKNQHEKIEEKIHSMLQGENAHEKEPSIMAQGMSWLKTNWKMSMNESDATVADLVTDGCNMGIKTLRKFKNQYENADKDTVAICEELIAAEHHLCKEMRDYL